jgi:outer membrane protein assembly factor BamB
MHQRSHTLPVFLILGASLACCGLAAAANWERFRGPNGTGVAADKDVPVQWTESDGILWKTAIPGVGHSSPIVWGERIFLQSADAKERRLLCLEATTGKILWSRPIPGTTHRIHTKNTLASSTPATDGQRIYAIVWDGKEIRLVAYDFQGALLWQRDLGGFTGRHGVGLSPIVYEDKVILNNDQTGIAKVLAFDARTGKTAWEIERKAFRTCYSTPFILDQEGVPQLIVASTAGISGYNPRTGAEIWNYTWSFSGMALRTVASPIAGAGLVFATSGDGSGARDAIAVRLGGKGDVTETNLAWEERATFPYVPGMLISGDYLFSVNDHGRAACHDARTGKEIWSQRLAGPTTASPVLVDGKVYVIDESGKVYVFAAAPAFKLLGKSTMGEQVFATPAVADNRLFIRGKEHLFCIAKSTAKGVEQGK